MVTQTSQPTQPAQIPAMPPRFDGNDPFWIIMAIAVLVKVLVGDSRSRSRRS